VGNSNGAQTQQKKTAQCFGSWKEGWEMEGTGADLLRAIALEGGSAQKWRIFLLPAGANNRGVAVTPSARRRHAGVHELCFPISEGRQ
jgi:hypothetical protein